MDRDLRSGGADGRAPGELGLVGHAVARRQQEGTAFSWANATALSVGALAALLTGLAVRANAARGFVLAGLLAFLSLDEHAEVHERAGGQTAQALGLDQETTTSLLWPIVYMPLLALLVVLLLAAAAAGGPQVRRFVLAGIGLLGAAVLIELATAPWTGTQYTTVHRMEGVFEEAFELVGFVLIAAALLVIALRAIRRLDLAGDRGTADGEPPPGEVAGLARGAERDVGPR